MRYCLAALMLFAALPMMNLLAAPAPAPFVHATIDLVKPPKGMTIEAYREQNLRELQSRRLLTLVLNKRTEFGERMAGLQVIKEQKDPLAWLEKQLRVEPVGKTAIRVRFSAGSTKEQAVILDAVVNTYLNQGSPVLRASLEDKLKKGRQVRPELVQRIASEEAHLAKVNRSVAKNKMEAAVIAANRAQAIKDVAEAKEMVEQFDAGQKALQAELDDTAPAPIIQWPKGSDSRPSRGEAGKRCQERMA